MTPVNKVGKAEAIAYAAKRKREGATWVAITNELFKLGFTRDDGKSFHNAEVCSMAIRADSTLRSYKRRFAKKPRIKYSEVKEEKAQPSVTLKPDNEIMALAYTIMQANVPNKEKLLAVLFSGGAK